MATTVNRTLSLDEDVARLLAEQARIEERPMSRITNTALRAYFERLGRGLK